MPARMDTSIDAPKRSPARAPIRTPPWTSVRASGAEPGVLEDVRTHTSLARPWNVIVHDDPITLMGYVTLTLQRIFGYAHEKATRLMMEVHQTGRSVVWTGDREQAEVYVLKLHAALLRATMEQVED